ncbi:helix-turn-helix transcriptional regulator [Haloparvum sedimenti]|uniref:helix-turn-helix transcriptional regulator n=1 Tax=Haloparvum sedimenti TaxID=1678448 RepID=UPI00071E8548|nr:helix-turn-helix domain-containing protein [Haloparvum sedimenti]
MQPRRARVVALAVGLAVCLALPAGVGAGLTHGGADGVATADGTTLLGTALLAQSGGYALAQDQPEPDNTITRIELAENGSAVWAITLRTRLETEADVSEYERFQESFRANESRYLDPFSERMTGVVANANETSDREMRATGFAAETSIQEVPRRWGVVTFRFRWDGFAAVEGDRVVVGDVFDGGFFIGEDDALAVVAPSGHGIASVDPTPDDSRAESVEWTGREDFADGRPRVVAAPDTSNETTTTEPAGSGVGGGSGGGGGGDGFGDGGALRTAAGVVLLFAVALSAAAVAARAGLISLPTGAFGETADTDDSDGDRGAGADGGAGVDSGAGAGDGGSSSTETAGAETELLSDEDRVRNVLADNDGRLKQSTIVEELGWSKSKTSRVLSRMAEEGTVEKLRLGRENVIDLIDEAD